MLGWDCLYLGRGLDVNDGGLDGRVIDLLERGEAEQGEETEKYHLN